MTAPKSSHLTSEQLAELKALLLQRKKELLQDESSNEANMAPPEHNSGSESQDDAAKQANLTREIATALSAMDQAELRRVERALKQMDEGSYGISVESGEPIPFARLQAEPMTEHTVAEKEAMEKHSGRRPA